jgi:hypothetical protein
MRTNNAHPRGSWRRGALVLSAVMLAGAFTVSVSTPAEGTQPNHWKSLSDRQEIEDLTYCYAAATDAIGRGDVLGGRAIYGTCFTPDAAIGASYPGSDPNGPPDLVSIGPNAWADVVEGVFADAGYQSTQHLVSNVRIKINGNTATMTSYLNATHVLDPFTSVTIANGTYEDVVVRTPAGWRIKQRTLRLISFVHLESPPAP